jgi:hypothetical protein
VLNLHFTGIGDEGASALAEGGQRDQAHALKVDLIGGGKWLC